MQTAFHVYLQQGAFHWANALTLLLLLWFGIYLVQSRHVRDSLKAPALDKA
ncbi:membrane protein [Vibrio cholerae 4260B]|nr:membrane protein [Vibrio cholerae 4260B]